MTNPEMEASYQKMRTLFEAPTVDESWQRLVAAGGHMLIAFEEGDGVSTSGVLTLKGALVVMRALGDHVCAVVSLAMAPAGEA